MCESNDLAGCGSRRSPQNTERVTYLQKTGWRAGTVPNVMPPTELWSCGTYHVTRSSAIKRLTGGRLSIVPTARSSRLLVPAVNFMCHLYVPLFKVPFRKQVLVIVTLKIDLVLRPESLVQAWQLHVWHEKACKVATRSSSTASSGLLIS